MGQNKKKDLPDALINAINSTRDIQELLNTGLTYLNNGPLDQKAIEQAIAERIVMLLQDDIHDTESPLPSQNSKSLFNRAGSRHQEFAPNVYSEVINRIMTNPKLKEAWKRTVLRYFHEEGTSLKATHMGPKFK